MRTCTGCGASKHEDEFGRKKRRDGTYGLKARCKTCLTAETKRYRAAKPRDARKVRSKYLRRTYGITADEFDAMLLAQGGCAICGLTKPSREMHVDHDHSCCDGYMSCGDCVRQILCSRCNRGIAVFREDTLVMKKAISYLEAHNAS